MNYKSYISFCVSVIFLVSCTGNNLTNNTVNPTPEPTPEVVVPALPKANAFFKIGYIQKLFTENDSVACIYDKNNNESVVTFSSRENGATLSFRMLNLNIQSGTHTLVNGRSKGVVFLNLGGEKSTNVFSLSLNPSNCVVNYHFTGFQMYASFQCQNIANAQGQAVSAEGSWLCNNQTQKDWIW